jgi:hypothetical protein
MEPNNLSHVHLKEGKSSIKGYITGKRQRDRDRENRRRER